MSHESVAREVQDQWRKLAGKYSSDVLLIDELFEDIQHSYASTDRYYHNLHHIHSMLKSARQFSEQILQPDTVNFAIFYHDIIYDVLRSDNEERSSRIALERMAGLNVQAAIIQDVMKFILASKKHVIENSLTENDMALFLDFDLSILASPWEAYTTYTNQVRQEYSAIPYTIFKEGRRTFLLDMLKRQNIFNSPIFRFQNEQQARENIKKELELL
jgi:predicted metal-dependent HD superfamily phosphohydrolase